jgi:uncharacterized protein YehS (DUF1456 family)
VHDDDLRAVSADLVAAVMLRTARVRDQADDEKRRREDEQPFNAPPNLVLPSRLDARISQDRGDGKHDHR